MTIHANRELIQQLESRHIGVIANCYQYAARLFYRNIAAGPEVPLADYNNARFEAERARLWLGNEVQELVGITNELNDILKAQHGMDRARNQLAERLHSVNEVLAMYKFSRTLF